MNGWPVRVSADVLSVLKGWPAVTPRLHDATAVPRNRLLGSALAAVALLIAFLAPGVAVGQAASSPMRTGSPVPVSSAGNAKDATPSERSPTEAAAQPVFGLLRPDDGSVVPLPSGTKYDDFLAWIAARRGPGYGINSVDLSGRADENGSAELEAEIVLVVHRDDEWVRVPLGFPEATLLEVEHSGAGLESYEAFTKDVGHAWSLQGRGEHRLKLKLLVPLTEKSGETRLTLTTPANAATTKLKLTLPSDPSVIADRGIVRSTFSADQQTTVDWAGPGGRVDLAWHPQVAAAQPADLAVSTTIIPSVVGKTVQLRAVQKIAPSRGQVSSIRTRLPAGFTIESVAGALYRTYSEDASEQGRTVTVQLTEATSGTFELTYRVVGPLPSDGIFTLEGFSLPDVPADAQSGRVQFERSAGYSIQPIEGAEGVQKIEMLEPMPAAVSSAYAFSSQPFHLKVKAEPIPPSFVVTPTLEFLVLPDRIDLDAEFGVEVRKGELREVRLNWPAPKWNVSQVRAGAIQEFPRTMDPLAPIEIGVPAAVSSFTIPIRASRPNEEQSGRIVVPLPKLEGTSRQKADVVSNDALIDLRFPSNFAVSVTANGAALQPLQDAGRAADLAEPTDRSRRVLKLAPAGVTELVFEVTPLERQVSASVKVAVSPRGDELHVQELVDYEVSNEPLPSLRLVVPEELLSQGLSFYDGSHQPLKSSIGNPQDGKTEVLLQLDAPVLGPFSVSTEYDVPHAVPSDASGELRLPVLLPADATLSGAVATFAPLRKHSVRIAGPDWVRLQSATREPQEQWVASAPSSSIPLVLSPKSEDDASSAVVSHLLQRSLVRRDGVAVTFADFRFERVPPRVGLRVPKGVKVESFWWRGQSVTASLYADDAGSLAEIALDPGRAAPILTVAYRQSGEATGLADGRSLQTINLDDGAVRETLWQLTLPESQHLFGEPDDYEARFDWGLGGNFLWSRRPAERIDEWFGAEVPKVSPEFGIGHVYDFVRAGGPKPFVFTSISRSLVVLIGAGAAILLGYAFANGLIVQRRRALIAVVIALMLAWAFSRTRSRSFCSLHCSVSH
jgi:hypothetical protein